MTNAGKFSRSGILKKARPCSEREGGRQLIYVKSSVNVTLRRFTPQSSIEVDRDLLSSQRYPPFQQLGTVLQYVYPRLKVLKVMFWNYTEN